MPRMSRFTYFLKSTDRSFEFILCQKKNEELGSISVDHLWMDVTPLYGQRQTKNSTSPNRMSVIESFWEYCRISDSTDAKEAQERVVLASLLPVMRSQGSRRIIADAFLNRLTGQAKVQTVSDLHQLIEKSKEQRMTAIDFHNRTLKLLGPLRITNRIRPKYDMMKEELCRGTCHMLSRGNNVVDSQSAANDTWSLWYRKYARRGGHDDEKLIMDILTYEARAAFHQCYTVTWRMLADSLEARGVIDWHTYRFLRCWHSDFIDETRETSDGCWSLFHGHLFALHPSTALLMCTAAGKRLVGDCVASPGDEKSPEFERLLHAVHIAVYFYCERLNTQSQNRKSKEITNLDPDQYSMESSTDEDSDV